MAYQRIFQEAKPNGYIWSDGVRLHFETTDSVQGNFDNGVEVVFDVSDTTTAESLFVALYDHLTEAGRKIKFNKKTGEMKFTQERRKAKKR